MTIQIRILSILLFVSFSFGCQEKRDSAQLKKNVINNEKAFQLLVDGFTASLPDSNYIVTFGIRNDSNIDLIYYKNEGNIAGKSNHLGGKNLSLHSTELDNAIRDLGWNYETVDKLALGLKAIQCNYIRNTDWFGKPINIYDTPEGMVNLDYNVYPTGNLDTVKAVHGEPIGQTDFLKRVYIMTSSAL